MRKEIREVYIRAKKPKTFDYSGQALDYKVGLVILLEDLGITHIGNPLQKLHRQYCQRGTED